MPLGFCLLKTQPNLNTFLGNLYMDIFNKLLRLLYKVHLIIRERFFLVLPPESHPPRPSTLLREGIGGDEFEQEYVPAGKETTDYESPSSLANRHISLCETLDRVLNTGVVVHGDITISVANIDLIYIGLRAILTSVETARRTGINHMMADS